MKWKTSFCVLFILLLFFNLSIAQSNENKKNILYNYHIGGGIGYFWIGAQNFEKVYEKKGGWIFNMEGSLKITTDLKAVVSYSSFSKSGESVGDLQLETTWKESFIDLGIRKILSTTNTDVHLGIGLSLVDVSEETELINSSNNTAGFYIEYGGVAKTNPNGTLGGYVNLKYVYAKISGEGGLGGDNVNVGGFFITFGIAIIP